MIEATPELLALAWRRIALARRIHAADRQLWKLVFWDDAPRFYDYELVEACAGAAAAEGQDPADWEQQFQKHRAIAVPATVALERFQPQRTECSQQVLCCLPDQDGLPFEFAWRAIPKHTDLYITTESLALEQLEAFITRTDVTRRLPL